MHKTAILAFGGNAILKSNDEGSQTEQEKNAQKAAFMMVKIVRRGYNLVVVHGNGPQAGNELLRIEESITKVPPCSLDYCVAKTEGDMGYMLELALRNQLAKEKIRRNITALLTMVVVDKDDPGFVNPTKPVGPYYSEYRAQKLKKYQKWPMVEIPGKGFRRLVASPKPVDILSIDVIEKLAKSGNIVIAGGGGGIPVSINEKGMLKGEEAVIDKDYTSAIIADKINADLFIILTAVNRVSLNWGKENQKDLDTLCVKDALKLYEEGQFPPGSMGPKILASVDFVSKNENREVLITSAEALPDALAGKNGTRIIAIPEVKPEPLPLF